MRKGYRNKFDEESAYCIIMALIFALMWAVFSTSR